MATKKTMRHLKNYFRMVHEYRFSFFLFSKLDKWNINSGPFK
jgi:hypothetical protein